MTPPDDTPAAPPQGPLAGLRVLDMSSVLMGPYASQILGDFGAEVIKVEPPEGDTSRRVGQHRSADMGCFFLHVNRNKRSVVLDLKQPEGLDAFLKLVATADVLVTNVRPLALARLGVSHEQLSAHNPRLVTVNLVGYGQDGPYAAKPALEDLIQGATGIAALGAANGGEPHYAPVTLCDRMTGLNAVNAILAALYSRERTGRGQCVQVPMFESVAQVVLGDHLGGMSFEPPLGPPGYLRLLAEERRPYRTRDGYISVMVYTDAHWRSFLGLLGDAGRFDTDPRFRNIGVRTRHTRELYGMIADAMLTRTTAEWLQALDRADIPAMPMHSVDSLVSDPHLQATGFVQVVEHPTEGALRQVGIPSRWSDTPPSIRRPAPRLGEHSIEVLREAGLTQPQIASLLARAITRLPVQESSMHRPETP